MSFNNLGVDKQGQLNLFTLHCPPSMRLEDDDFFDFCQANKELRIERTAEGDYEIMAPTGGETGGRNSSLIAQLYFWADNDDRGVVFDSSTGFVLPNGATRSPDASWVKKSRLKKLTPEQKQKFLPLCPDFVIELRSSNDSLKTLQDKMHEYIENGASLGWLIDPKKRQVSVFQAGEKIQVLENPDSLTAAKLLPGFELRLQKIWNVGF